MSEYRVRWRNTDAPHTYGSEVISDLEEAYEYRDSIAAHVSEIWIESARWEIFDEVAGLQGDAKLSGNSAGVLAEEPEGRRQFTAAYRAGTGNVISLETPNALREAAEKTVREFAEEDPEGPDYFVATRILPPWVPVKQGDETTNHEIRRHDHE